MKVHYALLTKGYIFLFDLSLLRLQVSWTARCALSGWAWRVSTNAGTATFSAAPVCASFGPPQSAPNAGTGIPTRDRWGGCWYSIGQEMFFLIRIGSLHETDVSQIFELILLKLNQYF
jgi:hypothetical protein